MGIHRKSKRSCNMFVASKISSSTVRSTSIVESSNQSRSRNRINSTEHSFAAQSIGKTTVTVFLQSFRENGSQFISSAYL